MSKLLNTRRLRPLWPRKPQWNSPWRPGQDPVRQRDETPPVPVDGHDDQALRRQRRHQEARLDGGPLHVQMAGEPRGLAGLRGDPQQVHRRQREQCVQGGRQLAMVRITPDILQLTSGEANCCPPRLPQKDAADWRIHSAPRLGLGGAPGPPGIF